jgi:hypothetical protein
MLRSPEAWIDKQRARSVEVESMDGRKRKEKGPIEGAMVLALAKKERSAEELVSLFLNDAEQSRARATLHSLVETGIVTKGVDEGPCALAQTIEAMRRAFWLADREGLGGDFLSSTYMQKLIHERFLDEMTRELVYSSILSILSIITSSPEERERDPTMSSLTKRLIEDEESMLGMSAIAGLLEEVGFREFLAFNLGDCADEEERSSRKREVLESMAERDIVMFFGKEPVLDPAAEVLRDALFPAERREEVLVLLRSSSAAMRAVLTTAEGRSSALLSEAIGSLLPLLEHLFAVFVHADLVRCDVASKAKAESELLAVAEECARRWRGEPPFLLALQQRARDELKKGR